MDILLESYALGSNLLKNRMVMAPMTRSRSSQPGDIPNQMMAKYYSQRASAGLIITEASQISLQGKGYSYTPGIFTEEQVEGWKAVTDAVHRNGGKIFCQLWHVGRMSHPSFHPDKRTVGPSAIAPSASVWVAEEGKDGRMLECPVPHELTIDEIKDIVKDYGTAAKNAKQANFDGVEIHAGNGYLLDEFLRTSSNKRTDVYGGSRENRMRLLLEVLDAVIAEMGSEKVGIRLSPHNIARGMDCSDMINTLFALVPKLNEAKVAYIHFAEADWDNAPDVPLEFRKEIRKQFAGTIIVAGNYNKEKAEAILSDGLADLVAFGRLFTSNPDLPYRYKHNLPTSDYFQEYFFGGGEKGYTDYLPYSEL